MGGKGKKKTKKIGEKKNDAKNIFLQLQHKELHEAHQRQTKRRQIMCFLSDKVDVNEHKTGILHKATVYMEQNLHSRLNRDSDSEVKIRNFFG